MEFRGLSSLNEAKLAFRHYMPALAEFPYSFCGDYPWHHPNAVSNKNDNSPNALRLYNVHESPSGFDTLTGQHDTIKN